jgi:hypothetical protein
VGDTGGPTGYSLKPVDLGSGADRIRFHCLLSNSLFSVTKVSPPALSLGLDADSVSLGQASRPTLCNVAVASRVLSGAIKQWSVGDITGTEIWEPAAAVRKAVRPGLFCCRFSWAKVRERLGLG